MSRIKPIELAGAIIDFCVNHNGCKLLDESETGFTVRNRRRDVTYFTGTYYEKRFEVRRIRHFDGDGGPANLFVHSVGACLGGSDAELKTESEVIVDHKLRKKEDADEIVSVLLEEPMEWDEGSLEEWKEIIARVE